MEIEIVMDQKILTDFQRFFEKASGATYAGDGAEVPAERPGFRELEFIEGDWHYRDSYCGHFQSWGQEVVRHKGKVFWTQSYGGGMEPKYFGDFEMDKATFAFLKKTMLAKVTGSFCPRGPPELIDGDWKYASTLTGDIQKYKGSETIYFKGEKVFTHDFFGGLAVDKSATDSQCDFEGVIIEESLTKKDVLKHVKILRTEIEQVTPEHKTPWVKQWTLHTVEISGITSDKVAEEISHALDPNHSWYADFKSKEFHYIIFRGKVFKVNRSKPEQYHEATKYGLTLGIPDYQLDFSPHIKEWERKQSV